MYTNREVHMAAQIHLLLESTEWSEIVVVCG